MLLGFLVGTAAGLAAYFVLGDDPALDVFVRYVTGPIGQVFLRLLFMLVVPLIFSALVLGVAGLGDLRSLARVGWRTLVLTVLVSLVAVALGVGLVELFGPGRGMAPELVARLSEGAAERAAVVVGGTAPKTGLELLVNRVPSNPVTAAADGDMLALMVFSALLGVGILLTAGAGAGGVAARRFLAGVEGLYEISMRLIDLVIRLAPGCPRD
jgi:DAACS family dicarboxylate/amino acid:cation (Na+ or H+) symporter